MRQVTGSMANVVKGMDGAMKSMDLEKVLQTPETGGYRVETGRMRQKNMFTATQPSLTRKTKPDFCSHGPLRDSVRRP